LFTPRAMSFPQASIQCRTLYTANLSPISPLRRAMVQIYARSGAPQEPV